MKNIPIEDRKYVLRYRERRSSADPSWRYYTGKQQTHRLGRAKIFSLSQAKSTKQFAHTTRRCDIVRITNKMLFMASLEGK